MSKLYEFKLFSGLNHETVDRLTQGFARKKYKKGEALFKQGTKEDQIFLLMEGRVGVQAESKEGHKTTFIFHEAPYLLGMIEIWKDRPSLANVIAMETCSTLVLNKKDYLNLLQSSHQLSINAVKMLSNMIYYTARDQHVRMFGQVDHLIANTLCSFARLYGEEREDGILIRREISKSELALILGIARRTVIRALQDLEKDGLIQMNGKEVVLPDLIALQRKAFALVI